MPTLFDQNLYQPANQSVLRLVNDFEQKYSSVFAKVKGDWLPAIREFLREETGLRMHQKVVGTKIQKDSNVSFRFVPDRDGAFIKLIDEHYRDLNFEEYAAFNRLKAELKNSARFFKKNSQNPIEPFAVLSNHLDEYFKKYNLQDLLDTLFKNAERIEDIWGTYSYDYGRIEVYYVPLILFCELNSVSLEYAILSVLVHEMAHSYHHTGKDKDNITWTNMGYTDKHIIEGMAEYFTWLFVESYKDDHIGMEKAYLAMFNCLADEYICFKEWMPLYSKEVIKCALLSTRKKAIEGYTDFQKLLKSLKETMH